MKQVIELNFRPEQIKEYCEGWLKALKKDKEANPAAIAMCKDIGTLVGIASMYLEDANNKPKTN